MSLAFDSSVPDFAQELARLLQPELTRCAFPPAGSSVTCAVSGGADSSALLVLAVAAGTNVTAVHVDHGLRTDSHLEATAVRDLAERFGVGFQSETVAVDPGRNLEARARNARYGVLPRGVLTGHTADDQAETILLNLMRGAGADGMAGMRANRRDTAGERDVTVTSRPLLALRRTDTEAICQRLDILTFEDAMNTDPSFRRVRVRRELLPLLDEIADRDVAAVLARQGTVFASIVDLLDRLAEGIDVTDAQALAASEPVLAHRAVRRFLRDGPSAEHPPDQATVERVLEVAAGNATGTDVGGGWRLQRTNQRLRLIGPIET